MIHKMEIGEIRRFDGRFVRLCQKVNANYSNANLIVQDVLDVYVYNHARPFELSEETFNAMEVLAWISR